MTHQLFTVSFESPEDAIQSNTQPVSADASTHCFAMGSGIHRIPPAQTETASAGITSVAPKATRNATGDAQWQHLCDRAAGALVSAPRACRRARMRERLTHWAGQVDAVRRLSAALGR